MQQNRRREESYAVWPKLYSGQLYIVSFCITWKRKNTCKRL